MAMPEMVERINEDQRANVPYGLLALLPAICFSNYG